jgi:DNA-binding NarL/FixJ family response regulator
VNAGDPKVRVLIADDSAVTRFGVRTVLERAGFEVCGEAADAAAAVALAIDETPDVCVLDMMMPAGGGIRAVREISRALPGAAILMLTGSDSGEDVLTALQQGASGYVLKDEAMDAIADAVRGVAAGERPMSKRVVRGLMSEAVVRERREAAADGRGARLTDREWDVLDLLAAGWTVPDAALRLGLDRGDVERTAERAREKLQVADRHAAFEVVRRLRGL